MKKFLVLFRASVATLDEWMKTDEAVRKPAEEKMMADWDAWMAAHSSSITETMAVGKTSRVTAGAAEDTRNDIMLYSIVEAESREAVEEMFKDHPHFGIPNAWIEVSELSPVPQRG